MSISLNANFELLSAGLYLDARQQFNTLIQMRDFPETSIPDGFITYNKETQKHYVFNSSNTPYTRIGKWREYNNGDSSSTTYATWNSNVDYKVGNVVLKDEVRYSCIADHTSTDFETDSINWVVVLEQYYHVTQEQYNKMVSDGLITDGTKDLYIIDGNSEGGNGGDIPLGQQVYSNTPIGTVLSFAGLTPPNGYLLCDGATYAVADYQDLYDVIGNIYGGDTENFNVPNLIDKFVQGSDTSGTEKEAGLPNITGGQESSSNAYNVRCWITGQEFKEELYGKNGAITLSKGNPMYKGDVNNSGQFIPFSIDASQSNAIYGNSDTVQPPALTMAYIIKAFYTNEGVDAPVELEDNVIDYIDNLVDDKSTELDNKVAELDNKFTEQITEQISEGISRSIIVGKEYPTTETCPVGSWYAMYY